MEDRNNFTDLAWHVYLLTLEALEPLPEYHRNRMKNSQSIYGETEIKACNVADGASRRSSSAQRVRY
jgi:hypothetical protein